MTRMKRRRVLIVFDGTSWFIRRVKTIEHDLDPDEKVYRCDAHLGGPFKSLSQAAKHLPHARIRTRWRWPKG